VTVIVPLVVCVPLHAPLAVHEVAPVDFHVRVALWPKLMELLFSESCTVGATGAGLLLPLPLPPPQAESTRASDSESAGSTRRMGRVDVRTCSRMDRILQVGSNFP
jgi:hypothetical protein